MSMVTKAWRGKSKRTEGYPYARPCRKGQGRGACGAAAMASHQLYVRVRLERIDDKEIVAHVDSRRSFTCFAKEGADFCFLAFLLLCMNATGDAGEETRQITVALLMSMMACPYSYTLERRGGALQAGGIG